MAIVDPAGVGTNANIVAAELVAIGAKAGAKAFAITMTYGQSVRSAAVKNASKPRAGPPGPRLQTGNLVRSITVDMRLDAGAPTAYIGSNAPYARRLELGFSDTDSLGRRYTQPPYPYLGPALDLFGPSFAAAMAAVVDD